MCLLAPTLCLAAHAAEAQTVTRPYDRDAIIEWASGEWVNYADWRVRDDDPDLVRSGTWPTPEAALAPTTRMLRRAEVDLDHDGVRERVMTVAPSEDPAPENGHAGIVVVRREAAGWTSRVLIRPEPDLPDRADRIAWRVTGEGLVVLLHRESGGELERYGRSSFQADLLLRVRLWRSGLAVDGLCRRRTNLLTGSDGWRSLRPECPSGTSAESAGNLCRRDANRDDQPRWFIGWAAEEREGEPYPWCRALSNLRPDDPLSTQ